MAVQNDINREKIVREIAEFVYAENYRKGLPSDSMRDWVEAERIYDDKIRYFFYWKPARFIGRNFYKLVAGGVLLIVFFVIADLKTGQYWTDMRNRPYLSIDLINPVQITDAETGSAYYGNYMILRNNGKTPASDVAVSYYMTTEADDKKAAKETWFDQKIEGISRVGFVAPGGFIKEPGFRSLSPEASYYYFETVASYSGLNPGKHYWTRIKRVFKIDRDTQKLLPISSYTEWDRDRNLAVPVLSADKDIWRMAAIAEKR